MKKGFTLLELLVVILIIGMLTGFALPQYSKSVRRAEMVEGMTHGRTIFDAAVRYKAVNGETPTGFDQLDTSFFGANATGSSFNDGPFTYILGTNYVTAQSNLGSYDLRFYFPVISSSGVEAPLLCCPRNSDKTGTWVCNNVSGKVKSTKDTSCYEIQ